MELYPVNWNEWLPDMDIRQIISLIVEMRLDKFGILKRNNELTGIHPLASSNEFWNDSDALDSINAVSEKNMSKANYDFYGYVPEGLRITNGFPVLVRVPIVNNYISGEMEITYYQPEINVQDCSVRWKEIKYYIYNEPENYEATQPKIRILTEETVFQIKKTPYRIFLESQFFFNDLIDCQIEIDAGDI